MEPRVAISCNHLKFTYFEESRPILDDVTLEIPEGSITVLMGSSGCGKSTLAAVLCGLLPENGGFLTEGTINLFGQPLKEMNPSKRAAFVSMMFQNPDLQFCMETLREELYFCMENISIPADEMKKRAEKAAEAMEVSHLLDRPLHSLSGGEKQRAVLTCIYLLDAKCIILDEPFANLDPASVGDMMVWMKKLCKEQGKTILAIDHMSDHWIGTADRFVLLGRGAEILAQAENEEELAKCKEIFEQEGIAYPGIWAETEIAPNENDFGDFGLYLKQLKMPKKPVSTKKRFFARKERIPANLKAKDSLLYEADAWFPQGKITAILGPSGCGKTSLMMTLLNQRKYLGNIEVLEKAGAREVADIGMKGTFEEVGIAFQNPSNQFITQNVTAEVTDGLSRRYPEESQEQIKERAIAMLDTCGLKPYQEFSPFMLSQGQQRRLAVLSVLAAGQKLLLLDEPTYGQDYISSRALMDQVREKVLDEKLTVIMVTHDRGLAETYADVIYNVSEQKLFLETEVAE